MAHKAEHAVDLETSAIIAVTVQERMKAIRARWARPWPKVKETLDAVIDNAAGGQALPDDLHEVVAHKGYHSNATLTDLKDSLA